MKGGDLYRRILKDDTVIRQDTPLNQTTGPLCTEVFANIIADEIRTASKHYGVPFEGILNYIYENRDELFGKLYRAMMSNKFPLVLGSIIEKKFK